MKKKKILVYMHRMISGGAERIIVNILNNYSRNKYNMVLVIADGEYSEYIETINSDVKIIFLEAENTREIIDGLVMTVNREKPDLIYTQINYNNITFLLAKLLGKIRTPVIVEEADTRILTSESSRKNKIATRLLYKFWASKVILLTRTMAEILNKDFKIPEDKLVVIHNPIEIDEIYKLRDEPIEDNEKSAKKTIIAVGRLDEVKDYVTLLKAIQIVSDEIEVQLQILGTGILGNELKILSKILGIEDRVQFLGFQDNPYKHVRNSDVFVLTSRREGLPNVIIEAMASGTPVISTDCMTGPREIIGDNEYGILVPVGDHEKLAEEIIELLRDKEKQEYYKQKGYERAEDFRAEKIIKEYESLFDEVMKNN